MVDVGRCNVSYFFSVVTGGSDGIGLAYAKELATRQMNLVLISRNPDKLEKAARTIGIILLIAVLFFNFFFAVVTGSSEGIGRAYARELAKRGFNVVLISKPENRLFRAARHIGIHHCYWCIAAISVSSFLCILYIACVLLETMALREMGSQFKLSIKGRFLLFQVYRIFADFF